MFLIVIYDLTGARVLDFSKGMAPPG